MKKHLAIQLLTIAGPAALALLAGACTTFSGPRPTMGLETILQTLEASPPPSAGNAAKAAAFLTTWPRLESNEVDRVVAVLKDARISSKARTSLVIALRNTDQRDRLPDLVQCLEAVPVQESELADELASLIVEFSSTHEQVFALIRAHIASPQVTLRYGCVDLLKTYFTPSELPSFADDIVSLLLARAREDADPAVANLACRALGEIALANPPFRESIRATLKAVSNDMARLYTASGPRGHVPRATAEHVRATAVDYEHKFLR